MPELCRRYSSRLTRCSGVAQPVPIHLWIPDRKWVGIGISVSGVLFLNWIRLAYQNDTGPSLSKGPVQRFAGIGRKPEWYSES